MPLKPGEPHVIDWEENGDLFSNSNHQNLTGTFLEPFFLTWINLNPSMDKLGYLLESVGWNYSSISNLHQCIHVNIHITKVLTNIFRKYSIVSASSSTDTTMRFHNYISPEFSTNSHIFYLRNLAQFDNAINATETEVEIARKDKYCKILCIIHWHYVISEWSLLSK